MPATLAAGCLDETRALAFVAGDVSTELRDSIEAHVDDCPSCRQVIAALVRSAPPAAAEASDWTPGQRIGRYVVLAQIGRGAMGAVYRAEDVELGRPVALKRLHAGADRERLVREARAAAQLSHPSVVTVHEVGEAGGVVFLAMELVDGTTLRRWLADKPRTPAEIVAVLAQAGRGLGAAHERGIIHRDFKPDNVLVDRAGRARVADFGLARADRVNAATQTGSISGTPAYMAPEVVAGEAPDARADQYALGVVLFEALHREHPFAGETPRRMWTEMANGRIRAGSRAVPARLDKIARRALAVDPADRWPDLTALVAALERPARRRWPWLAGGAGALAIAVILFLLLHEPASGCDAAGSDIARIWPGRWAKVMSVVAPAHAHGITEAFNAFADDYRWSAHDSCTAVARGKQTPEVTEKRDSCQVRARLAALETVVQLADPKVRPAGLALAQALPDVRACDDIERLRKLDPPPVSPDVRETLENVEMPLVRALAARELGDLKTALHEIDYARDLGQRYSDRALIARAALMHYELDRDKGDSSAASSQAMEAWTAASAAGDRYLTLRAQIALIGAEARASKKAVDGLAALTKDDVPESREGAFLQASDGDALLAAGRYREAEAAYRAAQKIRDKVLPEDHIDRAWGLFEIAGSLIEQHKLDEAAPLIAKAKARLDILVAPSSHYAIELRHVLSQYEAARGHTEAAIGYAREVLERRGKLYGEHSGQAAIARNDLANALAAGNQHGPSAEQYAIAVTDFITAVGADSPNAAESRVDLANQLADMEQFDDAATALQLALPVLIKADGADHPHVAVAEYTLVRTWLERKPPINLPRCGELLDHVEKVFTTSFGLDSQPMAALQEARGELLFARHDYPGADRLLVVGLAMLPAHDLKDRAEVELIRAKVLWQLGRREEAKATAASAIEHYQAAGAGYATEIAKGQAWLANPS